MILGETVDDETGDDDDGYDVTLKGKKRLSFPILLLLLFSSLTSSFDLQTITFLHPPSFICFI